MPSLFTRKNIKTERGEARGYETYVLHMAAADASGRNVCQYASEGCKSVCLIGAGRLPMSKHLQTWRTQLAFDDPDEFYTRLYEEIVDGARHAERRGLVPAFRLNGTSDLPWERMGLLAGESIFDAFPDYQFYDYTKYPYEKRKGAYKYSNYHLTFSWSEGPAAIPESDRKAWVLAASREWMLHGVNTTAVFGRYKNDHSQLPLTYNLGFGEVTVIDGDEDDLRFLDPPMVIVGLRAKFRSYAVLERGIASGFILPGSYAGRGNRVRGNPPDEDESVSGSQSLADVMDFDIGGDGDRKLRQFFGV